MEKPLKIETRPIYIYSMLAVFISIVLAGFVSAFTMKYMWEFEFKHHRMLDYLSEYSIIWLNLLD